MIKKLIKSVLPHGIVVWRENFRQFKNLGDPSFRAALNAARPSKMEALEISRFRFFPAGAFQRMNVVVDVGANEGIWSLAVLTVCQPKKLVAVEPAPDLQNVLKKNLSPYSQTHVIGVGVGEREEDSDFHITRHSHNSSFLKPRSAEMDRIYGVGYEVAQTLKVPVKPLDLLLRDEPEISLLKIDTQGTEVDVLRGARAVLQKTRFVLIEVNFISHYEGSFSFGEVHRELTQSGFDLWTLSVPYHQKGKALWSDALYVRRQ